MHEQQCFIIAYFLGFGGFQPCFQTTFAGVFDNFAVIHHDFFVLDHV